MSAFSYFTISQAATGQYKEKGSRFLGFAYPVSSEAGIKVQLEAVRKTYFDARHHCFAWILGSDGSHIKAFDDGEPHHSAGGPILGQIRSRGLTNVLVVVVRYFGGTKLGVGGLVQAYRTAAAAALANASVVEVEVTQRVAIKFPYENTPAIMQMVKELDMDIVGRDYGETCCLTAEVKLRVWKMFQDKAALLKATGTTVEWKEIISHD